MILEGKIAIVTGASQGIGAAIAKELKSNGAIIEDISFPAYDVSNPESCEKFVNQVMEKHGKIDILVNNAGITRDKLLLKMSKEDFDAVLDVNLGGVFNMTKFVTPHMMKEREGKIINITSIIGLIGGAGQGNYSASKAAIIGFTKSMARELGSRNITVNAIAPGYIQTAMTDVLPEDIKEEYAKRIPLRRMGQPSDVAKAVGFLASPNADYITAQVLVVDGGLI